MRNTFWIGVWPGLTEEDLDYFITVFKSYFALRKEPVGV
jgi:dTDP-4-amino-4,6-dideoxygalactose transaminase